MGFEVSLGRRIWIDRKNIELPDQFQSRAPLVANAYSTVGLALLAYGLVKLDVVATVADILITHGGKVWYLDRVGLLFSDMKNRSAKYATWITEPGPALSIGSQPVIAVLAVRGGLGLAGRTDIVSPGSDSERFRRVDRRLYSPLCLALAALTWAPDERATPRPIIG